jgi:uncharacterized protein (DUF58 family)
MISPTARLILVSALTALPSITLIPLRPAFAGTAAWITAACAIAVAIDGLLGARRPQALSVEAPPFVRLTQQRLTPIPLVWENSAEHSLAVRMAVATPDGIVSSQEFLPAELPSGRSSVEWLLTGVTRGERRLEEIQIETGSPLGLWNIRSRRSIACQLRVYPDLRDKATGALFQRTGTSGARLYRQVGKGREFDRLRQFISGDSYEDVYWKATARRGAPVVKLYQVEHSQQVYVALDCSRLSALEQRLDRYVDAALHLALCAEQQGDRFGLILFSDRVHSVVEARRGAAHFRRCRDAIYNAQPKRVNPDFAEVCDSLQRKLRRRSLIVFLTCLDDALLAETFERDVSIMARRHLVLVHLLASSDSLPVFAGHPPETLDEAYSGLAGQVQWNRIRKLQLALHNRGVRLSIVQPGSAKQQIAAAYLDVKRRQLL